MGSGTPRNETNDGRPYDTPTADGIAILQAFLLAGQLFLAIVWACTEFGLSNADEHAALFFMTVFGGMLSLAAAAVIVLSVVLRLIWPCEGFGRRFYAISLLTILFPLLSILVAGLVSALLSII